MPPKNDSFRVAHFKPLQVAHLYRYNHLRLVKGRIARSEALSRSLDNLIKNSVRPIAIGRKNYLFCGNDDAAEDAAIIYTMMGCCKEAGADFRKWTNYFLEHIHEYDNDLSKPLDDFLPATLMERGLI